MSEMFTCISCRVAFETPDEQRSHFATDWHRYNMKRRVAELPPLPAHSFNEKVLERREQNAVRTDPRGLMCTACSKSFSTENAFRSHVQSRKHRDREAAYALYRQKQGERESPDVIPQESSGSDQSDDEDIDERIAASRRRIKANDCLFCSHRSDSPEMNVKHMSKHHGFFIPDQDHLVDLSGLLAYLGEKVVIGNLCLFCPDGGKEFGDLPAARRHMIDKGHCKMAYSSQEDQAEYSDFYDFAVEDMEGSDWEDLEDGEEPDTKSSNITLAPDGYSLTLPSGKVLGHRDLKIYYRQNLRPRSEVPGVDERKSKVAAIRQRLQDPSQALVPVGGGMGAYGKGLQVMRARNAGEAKWAKRQASSFKEQARREQFKTRVGMVHNNQKHFRDPLLQ